MSAALVAVVLAVVLGHFVPAVSGLRRFGWLDGWRRRVVDWIGGDVTQNPALVIAIVLPPVLAVVALLALLDDRLFGLPAFLIELLVLLWCWGPRDLDRDVDAIIASDGAETATRRLSSRDAPVAADGSSLVSAAFHAALQRWFAVLLWFLLLGPAGALLYRLIQRLADDPRQPAAADAPLGVLRTVFEWPAAQLMTLALALAAHFDAVYLAWREWHRARGSGWVADTGFLYAAARASVASELIEDAEDDAEPRPDVAARLPAASALRDAMSLLWRMLIVWLTVLALLVLAGWAS